MEGLKRDWVFSIALWFVSRVVMVFGTGVCLVLSGHGLAHLPFMSLVFSQVHDDSGWFSFIASNGYIKQDTAFFPLYPLIVSMLHHVFRIHVTLSGLVVSNVFMIGDIFVMLRLFKRFIQTEKATLAVMLFALYPMAFFLSSMYSESLFIFTFCGSLLFLAGKRYVLASIMGASAVLTRNEGVLVAVPFLFEIWRQYRAFRKFPVRLFLLSSMIPGALFMYCGYCWLRFGSPLLFSSVQILWGRSFMNPLKTLYEGFTKFPVLWQHNGFYGHLYYSIEAVSVLLVLLLLPAVYRHLPKEWFLVTVLMVLIPLSDPGTGVSSIVSEPHRVMDYFFSFQRFVLPMFPVFAALAVVVSRSNWKKYATLGASTAGLIGAMIPISVHWFMG